MNIQAMLKQAQSLKNEMMKVKEEIDSSDFEGESSFVKVVVKGNHKVSKVEINAPGALESDDIEALEDMIVIALNNAFKKIDETTEKKMGKFGNIPGLF